MFKTHCNLPKTTHKDLIDMLNVKAAKEGVSKSSLVVEGLRYVLKEEIKAAKEKEKEKAITETAEIEGIKV